MKRGVDYIGVGVGAVIFNEEGKIFLAKRGRKARNEAGRWECPGGGLELGESFEKTIIREMKEEFDIDIEIVDQLATFNHLIPKDKQHWVAIAFVCKIKKGMPKILEPNKCEEIGWFTIEEMKKMPLTIASAHRLKQLLERKYPIGLPWLKENKNKRNIVVTLECFVKRNGKYLMLHRSQDKRIMPGVWMAPGGKREFNEGLFEAVRREILEETGLKIKNLRIKATGNAYLKDLDQELYFHFITADYAGGKLNQKSQDGKLEWLTPKEISKLDNLLSEIREVLPYIFSNNDKCISYKAVYEQGNKMGDFRIEKP